MIAAGLLGVERRGERRGRLSLSEVHRRQRRASRRGERMRASEDALACGQRVNQAGAGAGQVAGAHLQRAAKLQHAREVVGVVGRA